MKREAATCSDRRRLIVTAVAAAFLACAGVLIGVAMASQRAPRQTPVAPRQVSQATKVGPVPHETVGEPNVEVLTLPRSKPRSLEIPAIEVRSRIRKVGRTAEGALETPLPGPHYDDAAWYRHSPTPGSLGPAILVGHVDSAANGPSVFFRLGELRPGDRVFVTRADDSVATFVVDAAHRYAKDDFPTRTVYGDIDHAGLRIITCGGAFDDAAGHYLDNVVVFASLLDERG
jgi:hypothetical protein